MFHRDYAVKKAVPLLMAGGTTAARGATASHLGGARCPAPRLASDGLTRPVRPRSLARRVLRLVRNVLAGTLALLVGAMAAGAVYEAVASTQDAMRYPPPGRMVDVGGYQLHLLCMGQGTPTVLLDAWSGGWSAEWEPVQPLVAARTRVCAWDRAGSGWSDLGPHEHTPLAYTTELDSLLQSADIDGPYVLVAASYAGRVARLYTSRHPDQVLGVVFVDAVHEDAFSAEDAAEREHERPCWTAGNWVL